MSTWKIEHDRTNVVCPDCAFSFDAIHQDGDGGYTCPLCESAPASGEPSGAEAVVREAWRSVTDSLPKPGADVIAGYRDTAGRWCSVRAVYAAARSVVCTCERDGDCFCEMDNTGESWWPEGWYEIADNADDVNTWRIRGTVTHWMPLPTAPGEEEGESYVE